MQDDKPSKPISGGRTHEPTSDTLHFTREDASFFARSFIDIINLCELNGNEVYLLSGGLHIEDLMLWADEKVDPVNQIVCARLCYIVDIFARLKSFSLHGNSESFREWIRNPNPNFGNQSILNLMINGSFPDLREIRNVVISVQKEVETTDETNEESTGELKKILAVIVAVAIVYFGIRWYYLVPTSNEIAMNSHAISAYNSIKKIENYDSAMGTRVRRGRWAKSIFWWPIKPTEKEIAFGGKFMSLIVNIYETGRERGIFCDSAISGSLFDVDLDTIIGYVHDVGNYIILESPDRSAINTIADALHSKYAC